MKDKSTREGNILPEFNGVAITLSSGALEALATRLAFNSSMRISTVSLTRPVRIFSVGTSMDGEPNPL